MTTPFTHLSLGDVEDSAAQFGFGHIQEARFANESLETEQTGFSYHHLKQNKRQAFGHRHEGAEELYLVISGSGRAKVGDQILNLTKLDVLRVAPDVVRAFEGGPEGLELLAFGPLRKDDRGEMVENWWTD